MSASLATVTRSEAATKIWYSSFSSGSAAAVPEVLLDTKPCSRRNNKHIECFCWDAGLHAHQTSIICNSSRASHAFRSLGGLNKTCLQRRNGEMVLWPHRDLQPDKAAQVQLPHRHAVQVGIPAGERTELKFFFLVRCRTFAHKRRPLNSKGSTQLRNVPYHTGQTIAACYWRCDAPSPAALHCLRTVRRPAAPRCGRQLPLWDPAGGTPPPAGSPHAPPTRALHRGQCKLGPSWLEALCNSFHCLRAALCISWQSNFARCTRMRCTC